MSDSLDIAITAAKEAGAFLREHFENTESLVVNEASQHDIKLELDVRSQTLITERLLGAFPDHALYGEEGLAGNPASPWQWIVDPIDGTRDFIRGRDGWAVSVALISGGKPLLGTLFAPARREMFVAEAGNGAFLNGAPITASRRTEMSGARIPIDQLPEAVSDLVIVNKPNSIALRIAMVAADQADLLATLRWGFEWDVAAAALIAREAGAQVTEAFGKPLSFNKRDPRDFGVLVSSPAIHAAAAERINPMAIRLRDQK